MNRVDVIVEYPVHYSTPPEGASEKGWDKPCLQQGSSGQIPMRLKWETNSFICSCHWRRRFESWRRRFSSWRRGLWHLRRRTSRRSYTWQRQGWRHLASEKTSFTLSTETLSSLEPIWSLKYRVNHISLYSTLALKLKYMQNIRFKKDSLFPYFFMCLGLFN